MSVRAEDSATALLLVFAMCKFKPQQVIKIGSLAHLVEMFGVSKETVPDGLEYLLKNGLLIREEGVGLYLTELGCQKMRDAPAHAQDVLASSGGPGTPVERAPKERPPLNLDNPDLAEVGRFVFERDDRLGYNNLSWPEKVFICVRDVECEINNGGFDQYYFNSSGNHALDAVPSLEAIGAKHTSSLLRDANALFGESGPSPDRLARQEQLDALRDAKGKKMDEIEEEFYKGTEDLDGLLKKYISMNAEAYRAK